MSREARLSCLLRVSAAPREALVASVTMTDCDLRAVVATDSTIRENGPLDSRKGTVLKGSPPHRANDSRPYREF